MLPGYDPVVQALFGTLLTWGLTACGAALVIFMKETKRKLLDSSLGFAAGVMMAASYWSLLAPAIEMAESSDMYGNSGEYAFIPVAIGFVLGSLFVYVADKIMNYLQVDSPNIALAINSEPKQHGDFDYKDSRKDPEEGVIRSSYSEKSSVASRKRQEVLEEKIPHVNKNSEQLSKFQADRWKRILLLVMAITVHNIPEGLAVGVGFGAIGKSPKATFGSARNLAIGIGIQNFPEGLAVSLPLRGAGLSLWKSFWYGQLSGMVEPIAGVVGAMGVSWIEPALPYALSFAAGAMIYVVCDDLIPEAATCGNGRLASWSAILGFVIMMCLDVGLG